MNMNVLAFGAVSDESFNSTTAFNEAIRRCSESGGGVVDVPAGVYLCGTILLQDNVLLNLQPGSRIIGSTDIRDYTGTQRKCAWGGAVNCCGDQFNFQDNPCVALILADRKTNCGVIGTGTVDGRRSTKFGYSPEKGRPFLCVFSECRFVTLRDVTLTNPGMFTVYGLNSTDVTIDGVKIRSADSWNGDGLDFDGGKRVTISNCNIDAGDDAIGLKTLTPGEPCEDFTITNCVIRSRNWGAIRIGPESAGDMKRIAMSNCVFHDCGDGFKLQLTQDAVFEDLSFDNILMNEVLRPFFITSNRYNMSSKVPLSRPKAGTVRRLRFSNISAVMRPTSFIPEYNLRVYANNFISALPGSVVEDLTLSNVHLIAPGGGTKEEAERTVGHGDMFDFRNMYPEHLTNFGGDYPSAVLYIRNAKNVRMLNCTFEAQEYDERCAIAAECVENLFLRYAVARNVAGLLRQYRCDGLSVAESEGAVVGFTKEQAEGWEKFREMTLLVDARLEEAALACDAALALPDTESVFDTPVFSIEKNERRQFLFIPSFEGNFDLYVNGELVTDWHMPPCYVFPYPFTFELTPYLSDGENRIEIRPRGECKLLSKIFIKLS